jgi:YkoP domain
MSTTSLNSPSVLYQLVFGLDTLLRRWYEITEYSSHPLCVFRIQLTQIDRTVRLADGTLACPGDPVFDLHLWNEHLPRLPHHGPSMGWALEMRRCLEVSLRELARYLSTHRDFREVTVLRGDIKFCVAEQCEQMARLCRRLGFEVGEAEEPGTLAEQVHRFGQNILISLMVLALNGVAIRPGTLRRTSVVVYLSRRQLISRFGGAC